MVMNNCFLQMPGLFAILDANSCYQAINTQGSHWLGFKGKSNIPECTHSDLQCNAAKLAGEFTQQDKMILSSHSPMRILSYVNYSHNQWHLLIGEKYPFYTNEHQPMIGMRFMDINDTGLIDISRFIFNEKLNCYERKQFVYNITSKVNTPNLTTRQFEVLFFLLRGQSAKQIGNSLKLSAKTIETHIDKLKIKFACCTRTQLIDKAISLGFICLFPETLIHNSLLIH